MMAQYFRAKMANRKSKKGGRGRKRSRKARRGKNGRRRGRQASFILFLTLFCLFVLYNNKNGHRHGNLVRWDDGQHFVEDNNTFHLWQFQDEIPEADVVSDDGGSGDGGDVCEVNFSFIIN